MNAKTLNNSFKFLIHNYQGAQQKSGITNSFQYLYNSQRFLNTLDTRKVQVAKTDTPFSEPNQSYGETLAFAKILQHKVSSELEQGYKPVCFGFDHSQCIGSIYAAKRHYPNLQVVYVDSHADIHTTETSISKNMHGMPLALLGGLDSITDFKCMNLQEDLFHIGLSSFEPAEIDCFHRLNIQHIPSTAGFVEDIPRIKINRPIWLSLDIDSIDSSEFESTGYNENGLPIQYITKLINHLKPSLVGVDIAEVNFTLARKHNLARDVNTFIDIFETIVA